MNNFIYHTQRFIKIIEADYGPLEALDEFARAKAKGDVENVQAMVACEVERRALVEVGRVLEN